MGNASATSGLPRPTTTANGWTWWRTPRPRRV